MDLRLPPLGEGVDSGSVVGILVKEGEQIAKGQGIIELETGKAVAPVPSPSAGKVTKIMVGVGDTVTVGQSILTLETAAATPTAGPAARATTPAAPAARPARATAPPAPDETEAETWLDGDTPPDGPEPAASPTIRRLSRELGIDLRRVRGSEDGGRIVMEDVRTYIQRLQHMAAQPRPTAAAAGAKAAAPKVDFSKWGTVAKRPMTSLRRAIAAQMSESWHSTPRVTQFEQADITALDDLRKKHAPAFEKKGTRLTLTCFALKILAAALKTHPVFNTSLDEAAGEVVFKEYFNIGLAVDTEEGLMVPVLRDVDKKDIVALSKEILELSGKARTRKIKLEEMQGGTFTISNQGGIGGGHFTPIINRPEAAILGIGRGAVTPVVRAGKIEARLMLPLAVSYDHRIIDGGAAVRFMLDVVKGFENFDEKELL